MRNASWYVGSEPSLRWRTVKPRGVPSVSRSSLAATSAAWVRIPAAVLHGVEPEPLEHAEGDPLGHAFGQPLFGAALALRQLDLGDVSELVRDEPEPLAASMVVRLVVEEELAATAHADREVAELRRAHRRHVRVADEALLEHLARRVHEHRDLF